MFMAIMTMFFGIIATLCICRLIKRGMISLINMRSTISKTVIKKERITWFRTVPLSKHTAEDRPNLLKDLGFTHTFAPVNWVTNSANQMVSIMKRQMVFEINLN